MKKLTLLVLIPTLLLLSGVTHAGKTDSGGLKTTDKDGKVAIELTPPDNFKVAKFRVYYMNWWPEDQIWLRGSLVSKWEWKPGDETKQTLDDPGIQAKGTVLEIIGEVNSKDPHTPKTVYGRWHVTG